MPRINCFATRTHNLVVSRATLVRRRNDAQLASHIMRKQERSKTVKFTRNAIRQNDLIYNQPC